MVTNTAYLYTARIFLKNNSILEHCIITNNTHDKKEELQKIKNWKNELMKKYDIEHKKIHILGYTFATFEYIFNIF